MQSALVLGHVTSTIKHPTLEGQKLLVVQPMMADGKRPDGEPLLVVDLLGAGTGDRVMLTSDAAQIKDMFHSERSPVRWATLGLIEQ